MLVTVLLLTALAVAVPFLLYRISLSREAAALRTNKPPNTDTPPSSSDAANPPDAASTQVAIRGDQEALKTPAATQRPAFAVPPPDETTDITPHERRMLDSMNSAASEQFEYIRQMAKRFEKALNMGDVAAQMEIRLPVGIMCSYFKCGKPCFNATRDKWTAKRCSGCLSNHYCSKECQTADWKPASRRAASQSGVYHKDWCKKIKEEYMPQIPYFQAQLLQFPWGRLERDGTFSNKFAQARFGVLDSDYRKVGFWAIPERMNPHDVTDDPLYRANSTSLSPMQPRDNRNLKGYTHGAMMMALEEWPVSDTAGWKLQDELLIPHIFFAGVFSPPARPRAGQVEDWKSWYEWRGLSLQSPAALLMDHVITTYYLLTETLKVIDLRRGSTTRQVVDVHYLGAETELNYLPLFSELALLLPNTHVNLTIFSPATEALLKQATQRHPRSIAAREGPVWEYTAPWITGGGSIAISLYHVPPIPPAARHMQLRPYTGVWQRTVMMLAPKDPDAIVALNAGILSYGSWYEVVSCATMANIPFACTDYAQQSAQMAADHIPDWLNEASRGFPPGDRLHRELVKPRIRPVTVNPFHRPGQRPISQVRSPNLGNGFICRIV